MSDFKIKEIKGILAKLYFAEGWEPSDSGLQSWYTLTKHYIDKGLDTEEAGKRSVQEIFEKFEDKDSVVQNSKGYVEIKSNVRKSQPESVNVLMQQLDGMINQK